MLMFNPWIYSCNLACATSGLWARNIKAFEVFMDAGLRQQMALVGLSHPVGTYGNICAPDKPVSSRSRTTAKRGAYRQPSPPPPMPDSNIGLEDADVPV